MTNVAVVKGCLTRPVSERVLPSGDRLAVLELTVPGVVAADGSVGRAESVPAAWFGAPAWLLELEAGAEVMVVGRVRRRFFQAGGLQSRTEVLVTSGAPGRRMAKVADLVRWAVLELESATTTAAGRLGTAGGQDRQARADLAADPAGPTTRSRRKRAAPTFPE